MLIRFFKLLSIPAKFQPIIKAVLAVLVLVFVLRYGKKLLTNIKIKLDIWFRGGSETEGNTKGSTVNLKQIAEVIYDAFYGADWLGMFENEVEAIEALTKCRKESVKSLAMEYAKSYKKDLYADYKKYLSSDQYKIVAAWLS